MPFKPYRLHFLFFPESMSASNKFVLNWTGAAPSPISEMEKAGKKVGKTEL